MFGLDSNSIGPVASVRPSTTRRPERGEIPIREATPAEVRTLRSRPQNVETDAVATRHNLYTAERRSTRIYYTDFQQKSEVLRANSDRISTKLDDRQTVSAMLDLAQARGWQAIKLRGTYSFKREAWAQAQVRGMQTEGYQPKSTDMQEAERRKAAIKPVEPIKVAPPAQPAASPKPAARRTAKPQPAAKPAAPQTTAAPMEQAQNVARAAVWGAVEAAGKQARQNDAVTAKPAQKPVEKPAARPSAAAAA